MFILLGTFSVWVSDLPSGVAGLIFCTARPDACVAPGAKDWHPDLWTSKSGAGRRSVAIPPHLLSELEEHSSQLASAVNHS
jgi:hypothetical protein